MLFADVKKYIDDHTNKHSVFIIPLIITANFVINIIPASDRYLAQKQGGEFSVHWANTKKEFQERKLSKITRSKTRRAG